MFNTLLFRRSCRLLVIWKSVVQSDSRQMTIYRVIHKSVKHFKNSQQMHCSTDHGSSYADRERNSPSFFLHISQMLNVSTFGNTTDIYAIVHLVPHACQHITVDQSHSSGISQRQIGANMCEGFSLKKTPTVSLSIDVRINVIRCVVHLLRIF